MKKMSLKVDELAVESFETSREDSQQGTVDAYSEPLTWNTCQLTSPHPDGTCCKRLC